MKYICFFIIVFLFSCTQHKKNAIPKAIVNKTDSLRAIKRRELEKEWLADSLKNEKVVNDVIVFIKTRQIKNFDKTIRIWKDTSISAYIKVGYLFSKQIKHIFIRTHAGWKLTIYVYRFNSLKREITDDWSDLTYIGDEIKDINGDGFKDLSINWYPSSGCCPRNNFHIYLYSEPDKFTKYFDFINPTFYPNEKLIRGVEYGHSGEVPLYKYKWNRLTLDTIEYIYPSDTLKKKFYRVKHDGDENNPKKRQELSTVPKEYRKISGYDWFIDY